ncbi:DUF7504 family protein [Halobacterium litoreum]|uniref:Halobacterial output domain-containing protein n=1 Tax=Halobacterium litoreum TaxID=2039234 RepID=A0ABD5NGN8_9EURY|nr:hypothetical protein [Halobacterium litoreum]UHH12701.1 hypothetical protein LT972_11090 [Halobacterium litoreum]
MGGRIDAEAFSNELAELKRGGCNVLVRSDARGRDPACERLLGAPELDRHHVFLTTASDVDTVLDRHRPRRTDAGSFAVVDATPDTRSVASATPSTAGPTPTPFQTDDDWYEGVDSLTDYETLFDATDRALDRVAAGADGPGEVRLCLDGLDPFLDAAGDDASEERLFRFLHLLTGAVRDVNGMGHAHVSANVDDDVLATFEPLFDATLTIEAAGAGAARQRWRLHDSGRVTDWFQF